MGKVRQIQQSPVHLQVLVELFQVQSVSAACCTDFRPTPASPTPVLIPVHIEYNTQIMPQLLITICSDNVNVKSRAFSKQREQFPFLTPPVTCSSHYLSIALRHMQTSVNMA